MKNRNLKQISRKEGGCCFLRRAGQMLGLLCLSLLAFPLKAQETKREGAESALEPIIVRASRSKQNVFDLPGMNSVIELDSPSLVLPSTLDDIFIAQPWLDFVKSARRNGQEPVMRGFSGDSIIVLFDGVRQNFDAQHDGKFFVDPSILKRVEVLRGPNSALYGSGGLGGVIAFETKDAADLLKADENFGVLLGSGHQSVNKESSASLSVFGRTASLDILSTLSWRTSGDIKVPGDDVEPIPSDDTVSSGLFKLGWSLNEHHTLRVAFQGYHNNAIEPNEPQGLRPDLAVLAADVDKDTESYTTRVGYEYNNPKEPWLQFKSQLYSTQTKVREEFKKDVIATGPPVPPSKAPSMTVEAKKGDTLLRELETVGGSFDFQSSFGKKGDLSTNFSYGLEYYIDEQEGADGSNRGGGSVPVGERGGAPDAEVMYTGVYLQNELSLPSPVGEFLFIPGVRYDKYGSAHDSKDAKTGKTEKLENEDEETSTKFAMTYKPLKWLMIFGSYGEAFRAPSLTELYVRGPHFPVPRVTLPGTPGGPTTFLPAGNNVFVANSELKPERSVNTEGGLGFRFQDLVSKEDLLEIKASYFDIKSKDYIDQVADVVRKPTVMVMGKTTATGTCCGTTYSVNVPEAQLWGWEAELKYDSTRVLFSVSYSYINGVVREGSKTKDAKGGITDTTGNFLGNLTPDKYSVDLGLKVPEIDSVFGMRSQIARKHNRVPNPTSDDRSTPIDETKFQDEKAKRAGYVVYDLYYQLRPKSVLDGLTFKFGIDNVGDKEYSRIYAGSLEPGRNYKASLSYQW